MDYGGERDDKAGKRILKKTPSRLRIGEVKGTEAAKKILLQ